ncbi:MAG TPA: phosphoadenylyl-sulfate reductase [Terriglobales bacterium]|nr:phosphoadenylyl-sulfate reductase [Terriglobales bacterium]
MKEELKAVQSAAETWSAELALRWAFDRLGDEVALVSAFGPEGMVLIDMAAHIQPGFRLITIDTGFLFPETHRLMSEVEGRYALKIEKLQPALSPREQEQAHGAALWLRDPDVCCKLRKVEPLRQRLAQLRGWISSIRRDQTSARARARKLEWDAKFNLVKINPLAEWTSAEVWDYIRKNDIPYNQLHDRGYASIGCTHCTRAIAPGEEGRAGRWPGLAKTECGLHLASGLDPAPAV